MVCLQVSFQQILSVNNGLLIIICGHLIICGLLIIFPCPAVSHAFQGPDSSGSSFFRVLVQGPGPGSRVRVQGPGSGSRVWVQVLEVAKNYICVTRPLEAVVHRCSSRQVFLCNFIKTETPIQVFSCEISEIFKDTFSHGITPVAAFVLCEYIFSLLLLYF